MNKVPVITQMNMKFYSKIAHVTFIGWNHSIFYLNIKRTAFIGCNLEESPLRNT